MRKIFQDKELRDRAQFIIALLSMLATLGGLAIAITTLLGS